MNNPSDYGYLPYEYANRVHANDVFRERCAVGVTEWRVLCRHRDHGYWETVMVRWVTEPDHPSRQSRVGTLQVRSETSIMKLLRQP